ncbi:MAG TPA: biotin operon repressor, partial [Porticoccaceae bacterium]|nr:biotin operon repressor [Porticoccaceae bacterium]
MSDTWKAVLGLLASGERLSGSAIGEQLGISRSAVWKHMQQLQQWGVPVRKHRGQGYQIEGGIELLSHSGISSQLSPVAGDLLRELHLLDHIDSTNIYAKNLLENGRGAGQVCLAERQTQ